MIFLVASVGLNLGRYVQIIHLSIVLRERNGFET